MLGYRTASPIGRTEGPMGRPVGAIGYWILEEKVSRVPVLKIETFETFYLEFSLLLISERARSSYHRGCQHG